MKAALAEAQEFISQPEVRAMFEKHQARKREREQAQSRAQQESQAPLREEQRPGLGLGR